MRWLTASVAALLLAPASALPQWTEYATEIDALFVIDAHAVDAGTAYLLGTHFDGGLAKIYKTIAGGRRGIEQYVDGRAGIFFDGMAFWEADGGVAFADPVSGSFVIVVTKNGGETWRRIPTDRIPASLPGEAGFAASGTAITTHGTRHSWFGTGGGAMARVYRSADAGETRHVAETPLPAGPTAGIFGIAFRDTLHGVAVGGDYTRPRGEAMNALRTADGGRTWTLVATSAPPGVRYGITYLPASPGLESDDLASPLVVAVGPSGSGYSRDDGLTWTLLGADGFNTVAAGPDAVWAAGTEGSLARGARWLSR